MKVEYVRFATLNTLYRCSGELPEEKGLRYATSARRQRQRRHEKKGGGEKLPPFSDPDFDGKDPGEVVRIMGRAKQWLEARGYTIHLEGKYTETRVHKIKF